MLKRVVRSADNPHVDKGSRRRIRQAARGHDGVTLVEVIVATFLTALVVSAFGSATVGALVSNRLSEHRVAANQLVNERLERMKAQSWSSLTSQIATPSGPTSVQRQAVTFTITPTVAWLTGTPVAQSVTKLTVAG